MRGGLPVIRRFGRSSLGRGRLLIVFEYPRDLAEEPFLLFRILNNIRILAVRRLRHHRLISAAENAGENPLHPSLGLAGVARLSSGDEGRYIIVGATRR